MSKTAVKMTAQEIAQKWTNRTKAAVGDAVAGVNRVTESPMEKAAAKKDKLLANFTEAVNDGRWERGLRAVSLDDWKKKTTEKMQARLAGGVDAAMSKRLKFDQWNVDKLNSILPKIAAMPDFTIDDSINRASAYMREMSQNRFKNTG